MAYAILQHCCKDASCVSACPVNCIHPTPGEAAHESAPMLYVDPQVCIDCGACADACPVDAVVPADTLSGPDRAYAEINAAHYAEDVAASEFDTRPTEDRPTFREWEPPRFDWSLPSDFTGIDVAVVGTGPAGMYAAESLLLNTRSRVTLIDRLPMAGGLVRYGVAPDHPSTKAIGERFSRLHSHPRVRMVLGLEVGSDISPADLARCFDAVIYAVGGPEGRLLGVPGEGARGSLTAARLVGWYNAHPEFRDESVPLDARRAVVVGGGNVALDVARILSTPPDRLARTDIADHALAALADSQVQEVVLLARRGPDRPAYSEAEMRALKDLEGIEVVVDEHDSAIAQSIAGDPAGLLQDLPRRRMDYSKAPAPGRRIVIRFLAAAKTILGEERVEGVELTDGTHIETSLVVSAIGHKGRPIPGLPFDDASGTIPNDQGRVLGLRGSFVVGWIKRGATGGIGQNRADASETVSTLLTDAVSGRLPRGTRGSRRMFDKAVRKSNRRTIDARGLLKIDAAETTRGASAGRPRSKLATVDELIEAGHGR